MTVSMAPGREQLYFAFGSNLRLAQMVRRCPGSRYIGFGKLKGFRFQINNRGFANAVPLPGHHVEGLVYLLNTADEARLDRNEAVPSKYQKHYLEVEIFTATPDICGRSVSEVEQLLWIQGSHPKDPSRILSKVVEDHDVNDRNRDANSRGSITDDFDSGSGRILFQTTWPGQGCMTTDVLVYISENYTEDGAPREEYIDRMNAGIIDARKLGMSDSYIDNVLRFQDLIPSRPLPASGTVPPKRQSLKVQSYPEEPSISAGKHQSSKTDGVRSMHEPTTGDIQAPDVKIIAERRSQQPTRHETSGQGSFQKITGTLLPRTRQPRNRDTEGKHGRNHGGSKPRSQL